MANDFQHLANKVQSGEWTTFADTNSMLNKYMTLLWVTAAEVRYGALNSGPLDDQC